jgi:hypothetical protein
MKITIDNIINFMKEKQKVIITDEQVEEIKKHFYEDVENLVYWSFTEINRYYEIKLEGLISKEYYNKIKSDLYKDKKYSFGEEIDNLGDVRFKISDLVFNHDPEFIITYQCSGRFYDKNLNEGCQCLREAEYQGRKVELGKPTQGDVKKFKVYVKNPAGKVVKVNFGQKGMKIRKSNPAARKSFILTKAFSFIAVLAKFFENLLYLFNNLNLLSL